jgi:hypothetical protein
VAIRVRLLDADASHVDQITRDRIDLAAHVAHGLRRPRARHVETHEEVLRVESQLVALSNEHLEFVAQELQLHDEAVRLL